MRPLKISEVAKRLGVCKNTIYAWCRQGKVHFHKIGNANYIPYEEFCDLAHVKYEKEDKTVLYCRVSSSKNMASLDAQAERLVMYCAAKGYKIHKVIKEVGSGVNDLRPKLLKLINDDDYTRIVVEHRDRLTRTGFNYIHSLLVKADKTIEVVSEVDLDKEDLIHDLTAIIISYCERINGIRRPKQTTEQLVRRLVREKPRAIVDVEASSS
jgi:excisionase family DNA binding protein